MTMSASRVGDPGWNADEARKEDYARMTRVTELELRIAAALAVPMPYIPLLYGTKDFPMIHGDDYTKLHSVIEKMRAALEGKAWT